MNRVLNPKQSSFVAIIALLVSITTVVPLRSTAQTFALDATPASGAPIVITDGDQPIMATPRGEQSLVLAAPLDVPATLDPAFARDIGTTFIVRQLFRGLTRLDDELQPVPELADRIEISANGLIYKFHLRDGTNFQDGSQITASDIVFSLTRALDPRTAGEDANQLGGATFLADIEGAAELMAGRTSELSGMVLIDEQTVEIHLARPESTFLMRLASVPASVLDEDQVESSPDWWTAPNGSGPFRLAEWSQGERLVLEPSEHYFAGKPALTSVEFKLGQSAAQPFNLYQAGQIEIASVDLTGIDQVLAPESGLSEEVIVTPQFALEYVAFRTDVAPMDDPHIRRAVQLGFDKDKIASVTFDGHVEETCGLIPNGMLGVDWPCNDLPFDPKAARSEIAFSRYGSAEKVPPLQIYIGLSGAGRTMADVLHDSLERNTGLQVDIIAVELPEFLAGLYTYEYPAYEVYWSADYPDPESLLWTLFSSESKDNYTDYQNQQFDNALVQAAVEQDPARRADVYAEAQQILVDDAVILPLYYDVAYTVVKPYVKGLEVTPIGILGLERIWLER
jgi:peptide/nickel transport system substrate-binding protein/oligopeptide transport system substrate-binding protein